MPISIYIKMSCFFKISFTIYAYLVGDWVHGAPHAAIPEVGLLKLVTVERAALIKVGRSSAND